VLINEPQHVKSTGTPDELDADRLALQNVMMALVEMR
jgi:hypothetical protein